MGNVFENIVDAGARAGSQGARFVSYLADTEWAQRQNRMADREEQLQQQTIDAGKQLQQYRANQEARAQAGEARAQEKWNIIKPAAEAQSELSVIANQERQKQIDLGKYSDALSLRLNSDPNSGLSKLSDPEQKEFKKSPQWQRAVETARYVTLLKSGKGDAVRNEIEQAGGNFSKNERGEEILDIYGKKYPVNNMSIGELTKMVDNDAKAELQAWNFLSATNPMGAFQDSCASTARRMIKSCGGSASKALGEVMSRVNQASPEQKRICAIGQTLDNVENDLANGGVLTNKTLLQIQSMTQPDATGLSELQRYGYEMMVIGKDQANPMFIPTTADADGKRIPITLAELKRRVKKDNTLGQDFAVMAKRAEEKSSFNDKVTMAQLQRLTLENMRSSRELEKEQQGGAVQENGVSEEGQRIYNSAMRKKSAYIKNPEQASRAYNFIMSNFDNDVQNGMSLKEAWKNVQSALSDLDLKKTDVFSREQLEGIEESVLEEDVKSLEQKLSDLKKKGAEGEKKDPDWKERNFTFKNALMYAPSMSAESSLYGGVASPANEGRSKEEKNTDYIKDTEQSLKEAKQALLGIQEGKKSRDAKKAENDLRLKKLKDRLKAGKTQKSDKSSDKKK